MDWLSLGFIINSLGVIKFENAKFFLEFGCGGIAQVQLPRFHSHIFLLFLFFNFFLLFFNFFFYYFYWMVEIFFFLLWISTIHFYCIRCNTPILQPLFFVMFHVNIVKTAERTCHRYLTRTMILLTKEDVRQSLILYQ